MCHFSLFGDSVNTASRMESTSLAMKIHISETTKRFLPEAYKVEERGEIDVKGKGNMKTYWLEFRNDGPEVENSKAVANSVEDNAMVSDQRRMSMPSGGVHHNKIGNILEERRIYSPVTLEEVAKRSEIGGSPAKSLRSAKSRASRSSSIGTNAMNNCASEIFGDLVNDTEEFLDDMQRRNSSYSPISSPCFSPFIRKEMKEKKVSYIFKCFNLNVSFKINAY